MESQAEIRGQPSHVKEEVFVVLSPSEIEVIKAVHVRKPGSSSPNWAAMAQDIKVSEVYLEAVCSLRIPEKLEGISMRQIEKAMERVTMGLIFWNRTVRTRCM